MRVEGSAGEAAPRKKRKKRSFVIRHQGLVFRVLLEMLLPKTFTKHEQEQSRAGMSITVLRALRNLRKSTRQSARALASLLNADLPPLLPIQAPLRAPGIRHPYLLLPVQPRCLPLPVQAGILQVLERDGATARAAIFRVFTLVAMVRYTKIVLDHLLPVQKHWRRIMSLPSLLCRRTCQIIVPLHSLCMALPFPLLERMIVKLSARSPLKSPQPRNLQLALTLPIFTSL